MFGTIFSFMSALNQRMGKLLDACGMGVRRNRCNSFLLCCVLMVFAGCNRKENAETLAKRHCASCHMFPAPSMLDKTRWETGVLPEMAFRMGLDVSKFQDKDQSEVNEMIKAIPLRPMISNSEWEAIRKYYLDNAPDTLEQTTLRSTFALDAFTPSAIRLPITGQNMITMLKWNSVKENLFIGTRRGMLYQLDAALTLTDSLKMNGALSDIFFHSSRAPFALNMGIMDPNDQPAGTVAELLLPEKRISIVIDSIKRPVHLNIADLDNDKDEDLLVSAFGNFTGSLNAYRKRSDNTYELHYIHNFPGTRKTVVADFNKDGLPDIVALVTQGDEHIALFTNRGNFRFSYQVLLKFSPVYGSSYFELCDFNKDGHADILYTNGDNADFSYSLKPYHGVRIFLNDGLNSFKESVFYSMHGASMARAADFDRDGDLDIAAISFFPDFKTHPERGFVFLRNDNGRLTAFTTPLAAEGRWLTMEIGDFDSDSDEDIVLGALDFPTSVPDSLLEVWRKNRTSLLLLRNNLNDDATARLR